MLSLVLLLALFSVGPPHLKIMSVKANLTLDIIESYDVLIKFNLKRKTKMENTLPIEIHELNTEEIELVSGGFAWTVPAVLGVAGAAGAGFSAGYNWAQDY